MAAVPPAEDAADLLKNLSVSSQTKSLEVPFKKPTVDTANGWSQPSNGAITPLIPDLMDSELGYYHSGYPLTAYYYGGYDGTISNWDGYYRYVQPDGSDLAHGVYGFGYGYAPYEPYSSAGSPMATVAHDGQFYGAQSYHYPSLYFQPPTSTSGPYLATASPPKGETTTPALVDQVGLVADTTKGSTGNGVDLKGNTRPTDVGQTPYQNSYEMGSQNGYQGLSFCSDGVYSPIPWLDDPMSFEPQTKNNGGSSRTQNHLKGPNSMSASTGYMNKMYPNKLYGLYGNSYKSGFCYGTNVYDLQNSRRRWLNADNKFKPGVPANSIFGYNNENTDGLNELNRGPRAEITKDQKQFTPTAIVIKGRNITLSPANSITNESKEVNVTPNREQYNKTEFPETYADAKFFIIKSYSEDDVHKSIKYNAWASTPNGNKKLDAAYHEAQQQSGACPVFIFFSVNTSGQFVGVAEMVGPVDFNKSLEYWQQDKWIGCFPVKWHIVKDLPNGLLKHIILENNENKPVTNSRDTQEVRLVQGLQMIKIFKEHPSKQCILDDFEFYEDRQKKIQQKKAKQQQFQKQALEGKPVADAKMEEVSEGWS